MAAARARRRILSLSIACFLLFALYATLAGSADEKRISIYSSTATYSLPITDRNGREYLGLLEALEPLGAVSARTDGPRWKLRFKNVDAEFTHGKDRAKVHGHEVALFGAFLLENGRGLVPVASLSSLLPRILGTPVTFSEPSRRLFVGSVATRFTADVASANPPRLVLNFTAPVNPTIATEPGRLRMVFRREPIVSPGTAVMKFDDPTIPSATYSESNGLVEIDVNSSTALMASFSNEGRTITIAPVQQQAAQSPPSPQAQPATAAVPPLLPAPPPAAPRHFFAVVDASHGGDDFGVALSPTLLEKDVTLAFARHLRQELEARGISTLVLRDSDAALSSDQRAIFTAAAHAVIYIALHAASDGRGVRLYTSLLPAGGENNGPFVSWDMAQSPHLSVSQSAADALAAELRKRQVQVRVLAAPLRPLNNIGAPALAVEVAPSGTNVADLASSTYQQAIAATLASGIATLRDKLGPPR